MQKIWPKMPNLRWLHSHAAGLDGVLFPELVDSSVILTNGKVSDCQHCAPECAEQLCDLQLWKIGSSRAHEYRPFLDHHSLCAACDV